MSVASKDSASNYDTNHTINNADKQLIYHKLGYEWKNIYRTILKVNREKGNRSILGSDDFVTLKDFDSICQIYRVSFTREQLQKIHKLFAANSRNKYVIGDSDQFSMKQVINFVSLSKISGLHKESLNHMAVHNLATERSRTIFRLQQTFSGIEPVEEEPINASANQPDNDYDESTRVILKRRHSS